MLFRKTIILSFIHIDNSTFVFEILLSFTAIIFLVYIISLFFKRKTDIDYDELSPTFVKRITERERISKEIDAARHIQQSFLPVSTPDFPGLEIAANCIPAYEVGGDYYDYFILDKNKLGVVIADVSGKGIKAAFYMTLIKGIIKAHTQTFVSPKEVVSKLNKLLYEIMEKGNFVSLIYGVFDIEKKHFIFSNAGHNPIIYKDITNGKMMYDRNDGMALGLSEEQTFNDNSNEKIIPFRPGDLFILYTDGYTEAMNKSKEEFGINPFLNLMTQISNENPATIVKNAEIEVGNYIGKAQQHDDMTLVVIRIK
jgi:serine phosphatase RsbU (regulator of sigma subunit)